ncbi:DUF4097 family beta strand repeat-containing protein [Marinifilum caeruleilacunae]|uniref:DUF4097 domain-containing protein n=1 Tax=Marinifilum caeruleilacunae TaxID=2499076 RepID=A0ABX1WQS1_9BACT|nr:hypothetical protein [Marinifilum caeruleilacunae]NOU58325.1 hypothetical protein [Marinifilum caeruleilacunae]
MKKSIYILVFLMMGSMFAHGQKIVEKSVKMSGEKKVSLEFKFADDIKISTWDKNEVYVKASVNINNNEDNDAFRFHVNSYSKGIEIESEIENMKDLHKTTIIQRDEDKDGKMETITTNSIDMDLFFEVKLPRNARLSINTISGDITIVGLQNEMEIETISGFIDLSLPTKQQADLVLNTITGEMYSDFEFNTKHEGKLKHYYNGKFTTSLNGGGEEIFLKTISGDIFLRKNN